MGDRVRNDTHKKTYLSSIYFRNRMQNVLKAPLRRSLKAKIDAIAIIDEVFLGKVKRKKPK